MAEVESAVEALAYVPSKFTQQVSSCSSNSDASTTHSLEELSAPHFFEHQCTEIDAMTSKVVRESSIRETISASIAEVSQFCVTVADPRSPDASLIAVSEKFEMMTGYSRSEILGKNCRFLNANCNVESGDLVRLRYATQTGVAFTGVLENRRKSGELFLNLLDLRGLTVARNPHSGDELWFLIGLQADVTNMEETAEHQQASIAKLHVMANDIRKRLQVDLSALAVSGALMSNFTVTEQGTTKYMQWREHATQDPDPQVWSLCASPEWMTGPQATSVNWGPLALGISGLGMQRARFLKQIAEEKNPRVKKLLAMGCHLTETHYVPAVASVGACAMAMWLVRSR
mmetsp:Transcript_23524/g.42420  ORF Transcript_23524/g.42420 Transcript_23524/m.42420 type:complete len:344 (+) Transcript_23524:85-1116(+)